MIFNRVKQTTATTGSAGAYALSASAEAGFDTLYGQYANYYDVMSPTPIVVPYAVTDGTNWECGFGVYDGASPGTVTRASISGSSNGGAAVDWAAGDKFFMVGQVSDCGFGGMRFEIASGPPWSADDRNAGFDVGAVKLLSSGGDSALFICNDPAPSDPQWLRFPAMPTGAANSKGLQIGGSSGDLRSSAGGAFSLVSYRPEPSYLNGRAGLVQHDAYTTGAASPILVEVAPGLGTLVCTVVAAADTNVQADCQGALWKIELAYRNSLTAGGTVEIVGTPIVAPIYADSGFSGAGLTVGVDNTSGPHISITQTGVPAGNAVWSLCGTLHELQNYTA